MVAALNLEGQTFGELTAIRAEGVGPKRKWLCVCSCGKETSVAVNKLRAGTTKSCGHLRATGGTKTHGDTYSREYNIWTFMIQRCTNPNRASYYRYGGGGILVCERWRNDYAAFLEDMGRSPYPSAQLDRIDNDGDYEPGNCRWVDQAENKRNRCNTRYIEHDGRRMTMTEWATELNVPSRLLSVRIGRGWTDSEVITGVRVNRPPPRRDTRWATHNGKRLSIAEWARELGVSRKTLHTRYERGLRDSDLIAKFAGDHA